MKFMAMCSSGLGSSFMVEMNIQTALNKVGATGVEVSHADLGSASATDADVFFVGRDLENSVSGFDDVVILDSIIDQDELDRKVKATCERLGIPMNHES
ncbi:PTS sugar transporter subunit IIB [Kocuria massiliensis]|uniref:PTS sugar transporter subunit IIB n=1 Tax=Kocuria massiliensis TaxID=1926282 RepID=UPI0022B9B803|nr:PTS sugar transporter subunit IIB [Kocuria massiliensis]